MAILHGHALLILLNPQYLFLIAPVLVMYAVSLCVYRLLWHPLAKYPGPFLAKTTYLHGMYHGWKGDLHLDVRKCHEKYGTYIRYAPDRLVINTNDAIKDIYGYASNVQKSKGYEPMPVFPGAFNTHTAINKAVHGRRRRVVSQGFSDSALRSAEPFILDKVRSFCTAVYTIKRGSPEQSLNVWSDKKNMSIWSTYMTSDVISELAFGESLEMLTSPKNRWITDTVSSYIRRSYIAMQYPMLFRPGSGWLSADTYLMPGLLNDRKRYLAATKHIVEGRIEKEDGSRKDIMCHLLTAKDPETGGSLTFDEVWSEAYLMLSAGADTTATAMAATMFYLSRQPHCLAKLQHSLRSTFPTVESISQGPALNSCHYLRACLDEAMRMSPPAPGVFFREILPGGLSIRNPESDTVDHFPAGIDVGTGIYAVHHSPIYFPDPFKYNPDRWLESSTPPEQVALAKSAFMPFSSGPRACVAKPLAYLEMTLAVARIVWLGDMREAGKEGEGGYGIWKDRGQGSKDEFQVGDQMTSWKDGPVLQFRGREEGLI